MAKDKQGNDNGGGSAGKGAKVSKKLKKAGDAAVKIAQQPVISDLVAAALTAAAASLTQTKAAKAASREAGEAAEGAARETAAIGRAVKRALLDAARSLLDEFEDKPGEKQLRRSEPGIAAIEAPAGGQKEGKGGGKRQGR